ncbi:MAG: hypothetical protein ABL884_02995 [Methyloglobulus sp.]
MIIKSYHNQALRLIQNKNWDAAHSLVQDCPDPLSCRIHGYLHRIEGDLANARYWYQRAGLGMPEDSLDLELERLLMQVADMAE